MSSKEFQNFTPDPSLEVLSSRRKKDTKELPLTAEENDSLLKILDEAKAAEKAEDFSLATKKYQEYKEAFLTLKEEKKSLFIPEISEDYIFTDPDTKKETIETITLNFEQKLAEFLSFYEKNNITLPENFKESMKEIWIKNQEGIREAIAEKGFDDLLLLPGNLSLPELHIKMTTGYKETSENHLFEASGSFAKAKSENIENLRIVLLHNTKELNERPELKKTLVIKGEDVPLDEILTLEDYLVFQKKYFEETGEHLDEKTWTWLATKSGTYLVNVAWRSEDCGLRVMADTLLSQGKFLGYRPSHSFF